MFKKVIKEGETTPPPIPQKEVEKDDVMVQKSYGKRRLIPFNNDAVWANFKRVIKTKKRVQASALEEALLLFIQKYDSDGIS